VNVCSVRVSETTRHHEHNRHRTVKQCHSASDSDVHVEKLQRDVGGGDHGATIVGTGKHG